MLKTCHLCQSFVQPVAMDYIVRGATRHVMVKNLAVERCTQCREVYFDGAASRAVDRAWVILLPWIGLVKQRTARQCIPKYGRGHAFCAGVRGQFRGQGRRSM
ncbi:MAG: YgiT-type zinc finger protein [Candidatus Hydrogenedentes bacterium]|nr:YgiT-type zinc finger protein [Candidatus Hydrogenedentota bacterium]